MRAFPLTRFVAFCSFSILGCLADLLTKSWIFRQLGRPPSQTWWLIEGVFGFQTSENQGALFGLGYGFSWVFAALSVIAGLGIVYWLLSGAIADRWLTAALSCVMAGILGNLYDRLGLWAGPADRPPTSAVRDWILFQYQGWVWPNFNIADSLLVCGAGMLLFHAFFREAAAAADRNAVEIRKGPEIC